MEEVQFQTISLTLLDIFLKLVLKADIIFFQTGEPGWLALASAILRHRLKD